MKITDTNRLNFLIASGAYEFRDQIDEALVKTAAHEPSEPVAPHTDGARPPIRYCTRCQSPIDPKRVMRGSSFCGNECRREDMKERRAFKASKACRLCGRAARPVRPKRTEKASATDAHAEKAIIS